MKRLELAGAEAFLPARRSLPALQRAAATCRGCPLYQQATQGRLHRIGQSFSVTRQRGQLIEPERGPRLAATLHPSAILRRRGEAERRAELERLVEDLRAARRLL